MFNIPGKKPFIPSQVQGKTPPKAAQLAERVRRASKVIGKLAGTIFLVSVVVFAVLYTCVHFNLIHPSQLLLYTPSASGIGVSFVLGVIATTLFFSSKKAPQKGIKTPPNFYSRQALKESPQIPKSSIRKSDYQEEPLDLTHSTEEISQPPSPPPPSVAISEEGKVIEKKAQISKPEPPSISCSFKEADLKEVKSSKEIESCLLLLMSDFMVLELGNYYKNTSLSLSFLIQQLEYLKKKDLVNEERLSSFVTKLKTTYRFEEWAQELEKSSSANEYNLRKKELVQNIIHTLKKEKKVILASGFAGEPGHNLTIELELKEGQVEGCVLNRGKGINYHGSKVSETKKAHSLILSPTPIENLEHSSFLDLHLDLKMNSLLKSEHQYEIPEETLYTIQDVYEVLIQNWPAPVRLGTLTEAHSLQDSGTCTLKPFVALMKEALGKDEGEIAKLFLEISAFERLLETVDFRTIDLRRVKDMLAKLNRLALQMEKRNILNDELKKKVLELSDKVLAQIKKAKEQQRIQTQTNKIPLEHVTDQKELNFALELGTPFKNGYQPQALNPSNSLPLFDKNKFTDYLERCLGLIFNSITKETVPFAKQFTIKVLSEIPNPSDPFWQTKRSEREMKILAELVKVLLNEYTRNVGPILITPNVAILFLKVLTISLIQAKKGGVATDVVEMYGALTKLSLSETASNYFPTHPLLAKTFHECQKEIHKFKESDKRPSITKLYTIDYFELQEYNSLSQLREDAENRFLNDWLQNASPNIQDQKFWNSLLNCLNPLHQTLKLFEQKSFLLPITDYLSSTEAKTVEPIKQWGYLRTLYYHFILSAYFVGNVSGNLFNICFTYSEMKDGKLVRVSSVTDYEPENNQPHPLFNDVFLNTFYQLDQDFKKWCKRHLFLFHKDQNELLARKTVQTNFGKDRTLSPLEVQQLESIVSYDELKIPQLIRYFSRNFHRLKDPYFQSIFAQLLFSQNEKKDNLVLEEVLSSPSRVKFQLFSFLNSALSKTKELGWFESHLFLVRVLAQTTRFLAQRGDSKLLTEMVGKLETEIRELFDDKQMERDKRETALTTIISVFPYLDHPSLQKCLHYCQEAKNASPAQFARIAKENNLWKDDFKLGYALLEKTEIKGTLPYWVTHHQDYPFQTNFFVKELSKGLYEFHDERGDLYRLSANGNVIHVYRQFSARWFELKKTSPFMNKQRPPPCEGYFMEKTQAWFAIEGKKESIVLNKKSDKILCYVTENGIFHPSSEESLKLVTDYNLPLLNQIERLTPKKQLVAWKNTKGDVVKIELPQLKLTFNRVGNKWKSSLHPGYYIDEHPLSLSLEPHTHYLVLTNSKGKRIAILPSLGIVPKKQEGLGKPKLEYQKIQNDLSVISIPLNKKGQTLQPSKTEDLLYLIYLAMHKYDYGLARKWIQRLKRENPEIKNTLWIEHFDSKIEDKHPQAAALRVQLRLLMKKLSPNELSKKQQEGLKRDYFVYLNHQKHTSGYRLGPKEEKKCQKIVEKLSLTQVEQHQLLLRKNAVGVMPLSFATTEPSLIKISDFSPSLDWLTDEIEKKMWKHLEDPRTVAFKMRPGSAMVENFLHDYKIARTASQKESEEYQHLNELLLYMRFSDDPKLQTIRTLLKNVMEQPEDFPSLETLQENGVKKSLSEIVYNLKRKPLASLYPEKIIMKKTNALSMSLEPTKAKETPSVSVDKIGTVSVPFAEHLSSKHLFKTQEWETRETEIHNDLEALKNMEEYFKTCKDENPCITKEFKRLILANQAKTKALQEELSKKNSPLQLKLDNLPEVASQLKNQQHALIDEIQNKRTKILEIAHDYPESIRLEKNSRLLSPLSLRELIAYYGTENDQQIYASNPTITPAKLKELKQLLTEFLLLSTDLNQLQALSESLTEIEKWSEKNAKQELESCAKVFAKLATAHRVYNPLKEPHLLVFEYFSKVRLRKDQHDTLIKMTGSDQDLELEAKTGFGKSKVLIPLWLFLKSRKEKVSMMTVPASLFISQTNHLKKVLGKAFDTEIVTIQFDRDKGDNEKYLKQLNRKLQDAKQNHKIILTTIPSLHGMTNLKIKESLASGKGGHVTKIQTQLRLLREKISKEVADFFDESKECFNIRQWFDYAVGPRVPIEKEKIVAATTLYRILFIESDLHSRFKFEFLPSWANKGKEIPLQENYDTQLLPELTEQVMKYFQIPDELKKIVSEDLKGSYSKECDQFYGELTPQKLTEYDLFKTELTTNFRRTLFKKSNDGYGFLPNSRLAIPMNDTVPKPSSEFSSLEDYINFTIQLNLKKPFNVKEIEEFVDNLKLKSQKIGIKQLSELPEYLFLKKQCEKELMDIHEEEFEELTKKINTDAALKLQFIELAILPQIKVYKQKTSSTSFNLIRAIHHLQAASGTVNPDMLPPRLKTMENREALMDNLLPLWKKSQDKIYSLSSGTSEEQLKNLLNKHSKESVIIDVAGSFRDLTLLQTAQAILAHRPKAKGVLLFDDEGRELVFCRETKDLMPREDSFLEKEDLFIFIRKSKAVGTDVEMPLTAEAIVTIDRDSCRDLVLQGIGRMRKIPEGQGVAFAISKEDEKVIFPDPKERSFKQLLKYVMRNQGRQKGEDAFFVLRLYLEDLIDASFWQAASRCQQTTDVQILFKNLRQFMIKETQTKPLATLKQARKKLPAKEAVEQLKSDILAPIKDFCKKNETWKNVFDLKQIEQDFDKFVDYTILPKEIAIYGGNEGVGILEATADQNAENLHEAEMDQMGDVSLESENYADRDATLSKDGFFPAHPLEWDGDYTSLGAQSAETILGIPVYFSPNFKRVSEDEETNRAIQKPAYQYLIHKDQNGNLKMMLLDLYDARAIFRRMTTLSHPSSESDNYYLFFDGQMLAYDGNQPNLSLTSDEPDILSIRLIYKLFTATANLSAKEKNHIQHHRDDKGFKANMQRLLECWPHLAPLAEECNNPNFKEHLLQRFIRG